MRKNCVWWCWWKLPGTLDTFLEGEAPVLCVTEHSWGIITISDGQAFKLSITEQSSAQFALVCLKQSMEITRTRQVKMTIKTLAWTKTKTNTFSMSINYITNLSTDMTRTRKVKMKLVVTISQVNLWSSALWLCRFDGLQDWIGSEIASSGLSFSIWWAHQKRNVTLLQRCSHI